MQQFVFIFLIAFSTIVSATTTTSAAAIDCEEALGDTKAQIGQIIFHLKPYWDTGKHYQFRGTDLQLKSFRNHGWKELSRIAQENDTSVAEILTFYYEKKIFITEAMIVHSPKLANTLEDLKGNLFHLKRSAEILDQLNPEDKLKKRHWDALDRVYRMLVELGEFYFAFDLKDKSLTDYATINFLSHFSASKIRLLFEVLEDISEDDILDIVIDVDSRIKERKAEIRRRLDEPVKPVLPLNLPAQPSLPTVAPATNFPFAQPVQVPFQKPVMTFNTPSVALDSDLNLVLKAKMPLEANKPYTATTTRNQKLTVYIEKKIIEDDRGSENHVVRRLLKGIVNGNGKSGIKLLSDTGPHIIELKAVLHGHKRIIGCLEGNKLTLKFLIDIKDNKATYQRRIDSRLCL